MIPCPTASVQPLPAVALTDGHGILVVYFVGALNDAIGKPEFAAKRLSTIVVIPEVATTDGVVVTFVQHLRNKRLVGNDLLHCEWTHGRVQGTSDKQMAEARMMHSVFLLLSVVIMCCCVKRRCRNMQMHSVV